MEYVKCSDYSFVITSFNSSIFGLKKQQYQAQFDLVKIRSGTFFIGSSEHGLDARETEKPIHKVTVSPFYMSKYPITQAQWQVVANLPKVNFNLKSDPAHFKKDSLEKTRWELPVERVNWYEAVEFCQRLSNYLEQDYRLPTEIQWEYACKGNQTSKVENHKYYFGDDETELENYAWYGENAQEITHPVGLKKPNHCGLYDLYGNVWEWCLDDWHDSYWHFPAPDKPWFGNEYTQEIFEQIVVNKKPSPLTLDQIIAHSNYHKLLRGGSYCNYANCCRSAYRGAIDPNSRVKNVGFRVVCLSDVVH